MEAKFRATAVSFLASLLSLKLLLPSREKRHSSATFTGDTNHSGEPIPEPEGLWEDLRALNYIAVKWQMVFSVY